MEAGIVIHELAHGLSTRLTGGPKNSGCLGWGEAGGMGEGWGAHHRHGHEGFIRAGRFKKASNMNYALDISLRLERQCI
ncbi:hypothetical protein EDD22DRAFT_964290 [Suillus occidentalis]|nr:hypothetical protein EDD22DRAFT_964290 [Suillus occidentalis]